MQSVFSVVPSAFLEDLGRRQDGPTRRGKDRT